MLDNKFKLFLVISGLIILAGAVFLFGDFDFTGFKKENETKEEKVQQELRLQERVAEIIKTDDFSKCEAIQNEMYRKVCVNNIARQLAESEGDVSYCRSLDGELMSAENCEREVIFKKSLEDKNVEICGQATNKALAEECRSSYWLAMASEEKNGELCSNILAAEERDYCNDNILFEEEFKKNPENFDCASFKNSAVREDCAVYKENPDKNSTGSCFRYKSLLFLNNCFSQ